MKKFNTTKLVIFCCTMALISCTPDEAGKESPEVKGFTIDARAFNRWIYFSFATGDTVSVSNFQTDLSWDIAFHRWDVRTNSGLSGQGQGGALELTATSLEQVLEAPANGFVLDTLISTMASPAMPPVFIQVPASTELAKWMDVNTSQMPPIFTISDRVFIVRTATRRYAKLKFIDFTNDLGERGVVTFQYVFQPDGSRRF